MRGFFASRRMTEKVSGLSGIESADGVDDGLLFVVAEFGVDGEGEDFGGSTFGVGEVAGFVAEFFEGGLHV